MAAAGRFDYLLIESTGLWKAYVRCLVRVLVNGDSINAQVFHLLKLIAPFKICVTSCFGVSTD
jgi:hypothetical protein